MRDTNRTQRLRFHYKASDVDPTSVRTAVAICFALSMAILPPRELTAAEPEWPPALYDYVVNDQDLRTVLEQFGLNTGLRIALSDNVKGRVRSRIQPAPPRQFFDQLTARFGLDWYYDGAVISVSAKSEAQTQLVKLGTANFTQFETALDASGFLDRRYQLRPGAEPSVAIASGPPQYLEIVKKVATTLSPEPGPKPDAPAKYYVMIIRGSSAVRKAEFP
jgi:type III secretion protein C